MANGYFGTFISLRVAIEDFDPATAGAVLSAYFAGFTLAALRAGGIIARIGHIRSYAAFAGLVVAATAAMPLLPGALPWTGLRAVIGFGCAGIFIATESWLNAKTPAENRGRVFSLYMVGTFIALAVGQLVLDLFPIEGTAPFSAIVVVFALSLVMVSTTRAEAPITQDVPKLPWLQLTRAAPVAVAGCALSGIITSSFYALVPAWMQAEAISHGRIGLFMLAAVLGGLAFQIPVGWLSDRMDRRLILAGLGAGLAISAVLLVQLPRSLQAVMPAAFLLGGFMSTLYPVCVAHAHDHMPADRVVAVSGRLILVSGIGSVFGPMVGSMMMARLDIDGVLWLMAASALVLTAVAAGRTLVRAPPEQLEQPFTLLSPEAAGLARETPGDLAERP